jgi:amidase
MSFDEYTSRSLEQQRLRDGTIPTIYVLPAATLARFGADVSGAYKTAGLLSADEVHIVEMDATALAQAIREGEVTSVSATTAYIKAAAVCQQTTNCVSWLIPDKALDRAKGLDRYLIENGEVVGPVKVGRKLPLKSLRAD